MVCCNCGAEACASIKKSTEDEDEIILYYCKDCLRGHKNDESFFGVT